MTTDPHYAEVVREGMKKAPALVVCLLAMLGVIWKGGDMLERQAARFAESQTQRDRDFTNALADTMDVHINRYEDLLRATNVALDRTATALEANTRAFIEYNVRSGER